MLMHLKEMGGVCPAPCKLMKKQWNCKPESRRTFLLSSHSQNRARVPSVDSRRYKRQNVQSTIMLLRRIRRCGRRWIICNGYCVGCHPHSLRGSGDGGSSGRDSLPRTTQYGGMYVPLAGARQLMAVFSRISARTAEQICETRRKGNDMACYHSGLCSMRNSVSCMDGRQRKRAGRL